MDFSELVLLFLLLLFLFVLFLYDIVFVFRLFLVFLVSLSLLFFFFSPSFLIISKVAGLRAGPGSEEEVLFSWGFPLAGSFCFSCACFF